MKTSENTNTSTRAHTLSKVTLPHHLYKALAKSEFSVFRKARARVKQLRIRRKIFKIITKSTISRHFDVAALFLRVMWVCAKLNQWKRSTAVHIYLSKRFIIHLTFINKRKAA